MADPRELAFTAYGVPVAVTHAAEFTQSIDEILPPGWQPCDPETASLHFTVTRNQENDVDIAVDGHHLLTTSSVDLALGVLDPQIRAHIALHAPDFIFVHAGAVAVDGRGVMLPGLTFTGKTTLVAELARAGAEYYSDEYAVLDADGRMHPYARPLAIRPDGAAEPATPTPVAALDGVAGQQPVDVGLIAVTQYRPGAKWSPREMTAGVALLALLSNTIPARTRSDEALRALAAASEGAVAVETERGEADETAEAILAMLA